MVELLLSKGADVNALDSFSITALHTASGNGDLAMVELLESKGADANSRGQTGATALHLVSRGDHMAKIELLLSKGADIDARNDDDDETALQVAPHNNRQSIVDPSTSKGAR